MSPIKAFKSLRQHVGDSQQAFATRLGLSIRAVANYEKDRIPGSKGLAALIKAAHDSGREDLADVFRKALWEQVGERTPGLTTEESVWAGLLLALLRNRGLPEVDAAWNAVRDTLRRQVSTVIAKSEESGNPDLAEVAEQVKGDWLAAAGWSAQYESEKTKRV